MKLKYKFVIHNIGGSPTAVTVGDDHARFSGMIKLNETGEFIFRSLMQGSSSDEIAAKISENYNITKEQALADTKKYIGSLTDAGLLEE